MKQKILFAICLLCSVASAQTAIDMAGLKGKSAEELRDAYAISVPQHSDWEVGIKATVKIEGWDRVVFHFNGTGRLSSVSFLFDQPMTVDRAMKLCKTALGISLPASRRVDAPAGVFFRGLGSPIKTVNLTNQSDAFAIRDQGVDYISVHYDIGWRE